MSLKPTATADSLRGVLEGILRSAEAELRSMSRADLETWWHFRYDPDKSPPYNTYQFIRLIELYGGQCRRWEEMHHGHVCVVERVRDQYLLPKITAFLAELAVATSPAASTRETQAPGPP